MKHKGRVSWVWAVSVVWVTGVGVGWAQSVTGLAPMTVLGKREDVFMETGSASYVSGDRIRAAGASSIHQVLAQVPGVYVREEDGYGNFPNVSLRGADGTRSEKVTVMEDGILAAPAPYAGPAAYSTPRVGRMAGMEVLKGSSQVRYGPQTTGGVVNHLSTPVPGKAAGYLKATYGDYGTLYGHAHAGRTVETAAGRVGYLLEFQGNGSDGFREIDGTAADTGFSMWEPVVKVVFEPAGALKQRFEFKAVNTTFDADETYTGLVEADLRATPDRRYAATRFDRMESSHLRTHLKWIAEPSAAWRVESALYQGSFGRNWYKLDKVSGAAGRKRALHEVLATGGSYGNELAVLRGSAAGVLDVKANDRDYSMYGWQNQVNHRFGTGDFEHDLAAGLRFHFDDQDRHHWLDSYAADGAGDFTLTGRTRAGQDDKLEEVFATAVYLEDEIRIGGLTLRPGLRHEWLDLDFTNRKDPSKNRSGDEGFWMGGLSASQRLDEEHTVFGGVHRGVSSPGVEAYLLEGVDEEEATGWELGIRRREGWTNVELAGFFTDFDNLISTDTGLGGEPSRNAGAAQVFGLESVVQHDAGRAAGFAWGVPMYLSATWTEASFRGTTPGLAGGGDGIYAGGRDGNELPYLPEWRLAAGLGVDAGAWGANLDLAYQGTCWGTGYNEGKRPGTPSSRDGKIDSLLTFDLSTWYQLHETTRLVAGVRNLFDERALVSRVPEGPRANAPRMIHFGIESKF